MATRQTAQAFAGFVMKVLMVGVLLVAGACDKRLPDSGLPASGEGGEVNKKASELGDARERCGELAGKQFMECREVPRFETMPDCAVFALAGRGANGRGCVPGEFSLQMSAPAAPGREVEVYVDLLPSGELRILKEVGSVGVRPGGVQILRVDSSFVPEGFEGIAPRFDD